MTLKEFLSMSMMAIALLGLGIAVRANGDEHGHKHDESKKENKEHADEHGHQEKDDAHGEHKDHGEEKEDEHGHGDEHGDEHGEHGEEEEGSSRVGPGKAITEASKKNGIRLSEKAVKTIGIRTETVNSENTHKISPKSLVYFQDEVGFYRLRDGLYKLVEVKVEKKSVTEAIVRTSELKPGDHVVVDGVGLLRTAELEAWGGSGDGHGH